MRKIKYLFSAIVVVLLCCMAAMANEAASFDEYFNYAIRMIHSDDVSIASVEEGDDTFACKRLMVLFENGAYLPEGVTPQDYVLYENTGVYSFRTKAETELAYNILNNLPDVKSVLIDSVITLDKDIQRVTPTGKIDDIVADLEIKNWGISAVHADTFKDYVATQSPEEVVVGIVDTGLCTNHLYFKDSPRVIEGVNLIQPGQPVSDYNGHGTHVAGIVAASSSDNVKIKMYQIFGNNNETQPSLLNLAVQAAINDGVDVINLSLEMPCGGSSLHNLLDEAYNAGIIVVAAAGNGGSDYKGDPVNGDSHNSAICPAHYSEHVITVGAVDSELKVADYSNYGPEIDISAPGTNIYSTYIPQTGKDEGYGHGNGTSQATPFVAAYVAMMKSLNNALSFEELCETLSKYAYVPEGWDSEKNGTGILDMSCVTTLVDNIHTHKAWFYKDELLNEIDFELQIENQTADLITVYAHFSFLNDKGVQIGYSFLPIQIQSTKKPTYTVPMENIPDGTATIKGYVWIDSMEPVSMVSDYVIPIEE